MSVLVDEFSMCPEAVMRMPFKRFTAWQALAFRRSVGRRNEQLRREADEQR